VARANGQEEAFEHLYRRHRGELYRFLLRRTGNPADAEDVAQTAFLNAYRALARGRAPAPKWMRIAMSS
jgi:DNA-directed RNA polymerase specialized sigma24 family protein